MVELAPQEQVMLEDDDTSDLDERLRQLRTKIRPYFRMLDRVPSSDLENVLISDDTAPFPDWARNNNTVVETEALLERLAIAHDRRKDMMLEKWNSILTGWSDLKDQEDLSLQFSINHPDIEKALKGLEVALTERNTEKEARMKSIAASIAHLRAELTAVWDACHVYDEDKAHFMSRFASQNFSEDLYEAHRAELGVWKSYQRKNRALMEKLSRRQQMWSEMVELEMKADDPSRFVNRGATLLKDQNTLNYVRKNLPKVEEELLRLATKFSIDHGRAFKIHGKEICTLIDEDWTRFKNEKTKKKFERTGSTNGQPPPGQGQTQTAIFAATPSRKRPALHPPRTPIPFKK